MAAIESSGDFEGCARLGFEVLRLYMVRAVQCDFRQKLSNSTGAWAGANIGLVSKFHEAELMIHSRLCHCQDVTIEWHLIMSRRETDQPARPPTASLHRSR